MTTVVDSHPAIDLLREEFAGIEERVSKFDLADAIRAGSKHTDKATTWRSGDSVCALSAALIATKARS